VDIKGNLFLKNTILVLVILFLILGLFIGISYLPLFEKKISNKVPYTAKESYTTSEPQIYYVEECETEISLSLGENIIKGIDAFKNSDVKEFYEDCEDVAKTRYIKKTNYRDVIKYKSESEVIKVNYWDR
jgi:hypothetical protein